MSQITDKKSIPLRLFHSAEEYNVTIELKTGEIYHGKLVSSSHNMDCQLNDALLINDNDNNNNKNKKINSIFIRGSNVLYISLPDLLSKQKMFNTFETKKNQFIEYKQNILRRKRQQQEIAKQKKMYLTQKSLNLPGF